MKLQLASLALAVAASLGNATPDAEMTSLVLRSAPFIIFAKEAPSTLPEYDVDKDFNYFFFSDMMGEASGIPPSFLADGSRNAKTDFPIDYEQYFIDDAEVCTEHFAPDVKVITEPWTTPATSTILETRKTCIVDENDQQLYMLGCFNFHDDIELGITSFRAIPSLPAALEPLDHVPTSWYTQAFEQLPFSVRLYSDKEMNSLLAENALAKIDFVSDEELVDALGLVAGADGLGGEFQSYHVGGSDYRLWIWSVSLEDEEVWAVAYRPRNTPMPKLVKKTIRESKKP